MLNIQHVAHDAQEFSTVIRRLINSVATLQYNESVDEGGGDKARIDHYNMMMYDLRELDQQATRVRLGLGRTTDDIGQVAEQLILLAGISRNADYTVSAFDLKDVGTVDPDARATDQVPRE